MKLFPGGFAGEKFPALTGVRAIAAYLVFLHHYTPFASAMPTPLRDFLSECHVGVTLFYVLSGFLITYNYWDRAQQGLTKSFWIQYMGRRIARIYPLYLFLLALTFLRPSLLGLGDAPSLAELLLNVTLLKGFFSVFAFTGIAPSWSLTIEETFYLLAPFIFVLVRKFGYVFVQVLLYGIGGLLLLVGSMSRFYGFFDSFHFVVLYTFFGRSFEFLIGVALARTLLTRPKVFAPSGKVSLTLLGVLGCTLVVYCLSVLRIGNTMGLYHPIGMALNNVVLPITTCVLFQGLISESTMVSRMLSSRFFVFLGRASYSFYLVHYGFIPLLVILPRLTISNDILRLGVLFLLVNVVSAFLFLSVEHPANQVIRREVELFVRTKSSITGEKIGIFRRYRLVLAGASATILLIWCGVHFGWFRSAPDVGGRPAQVAGGRSLSVVSLTPSSASGSNQTFSIKISYSESVTDVGIYLLVNNQSMSANGCQVVYNRAMNIIWLVADDGNTWLPSGAVGAGSVSSNAQCMVAPAESSVSKTGDILTLNLKLTFKPAFLGQKNIYVMAADQRGNSSGWQQLGTWTN